jgi:amino acid transporter
MLYMLSILTIGWTVPSSDPRLLSESGNASQSPFVIAMEIAGIKGLPHFVNALIFSSAFSAGNAYLYSASRILYGGWHIKVIQLGVSDPFQGLSLRGQAPLIFARCTAKGLPLISVIFCVG